MFVVHDERYVYQRRHGEKVPILSAVRGKDGERGMCDLISRKDAIEALEIIADKMPQEGQIVMRQAQGIIRDLRSFTPCSEPPQDKRFMKMEGVE